MARNMRRLIGLLSSAGILLGSVLGGASASRGQATTSLHDIPWYMGHDAARSATLNLCRNDHRFARDADCLNAETAEDRLWGQRAAKGAAPGQRQAQKGGGLFDDLTSPQYWADNRLSRLGVLASCKHPPTIYQPDVCAAAQQGDSLDAARRGRP
jgi:hypothetical protein